MGFDFMKFNFISDKLKNKIIGNKLWKHKKRILITTPIFLILFLIYSLIYNLGPTVGVILTMVLKPRFQIEKVDLSQKGEVYAKGVILSYKGQKIVQAPSVKLEYELKGEFRDWIKSIDVYNANILIERKGDKVNIAEAFSSNSPGKSGTGVPIKIIRATDANTTYRDISYDFPIEKNVPKLNGYVTFDKEKGIDLIFGGKSGASDLSYSFTNYFEDYSMTIKGKNIDVDTTLLQYAYYYKEVQYSGGTCDLDLTVASSGLYGKADVKNMQVNYSDFLEPIKNFNAHVDFLKDKIDINGKFELFKKKKDFKLNYNTIDGLNIDILLGKMNYEEVSKYKLLNDLKYKNNFDFQDVSVKLKTDKVGDFFVLVNSEVGELKDGNVSFKNLNPQLSYNATKNQLVVKNKSLGIDYLGIEKNLDVEFQLKSKIGDLNYKIDGMDGNIQLEFKKDEIVINSKSGYIVTKGSYNYNNKILELYEKKFITKDFELVYDFNEMNLIKYIGTLDFNLSSNLNGTMKGDLKNGVGEINEVILYDINNKEAANMVGAIDIKNKNYDIKFTTHLLPINYSIGDIELLVKGSLDGVYKKRAEEYSLEVAGEIDSLKYKGLETHGIKSNLRVSNNKLEIKKLGNAFFEVTGGINLKKEELNLKYKINNLTNEKLALEKVKFNIKEAIGEIKGKFSNPKMDFKVNSAEVYSQNSEPVYIDVNGSLENKKIAFKEILINKKSKVQGYYDLSDDKYKFSGELLMESLPKYTEDKFFKYRVIGLFDVVGQNGDVNVKTNYTVDNIYYKGDKLPNVEGKMVYDATNYYDGVLTVDYLKIMNSKKEQLGILKGNLDLKTQEIKFKMSEEKVQLSKILEQENISGELKIDVNILGTLKEPKYSMDIFSNEIKIKKALLNSVKLNLKGDNNNLTLNNFSFLYEKNLLESSGKYSLNEKKYLYNIVSKNIKIDFLNAVLDEYGVKDIRGESQIDFSFTEGGNEGYFSGTDIYFEIPKYSVIVKDLDYNVKLNKNILKLEEFKGSINGGDLDMKGYFNVPSIGEIKNNPYFYEGMDYEFSLKMDHVTYEYPEHFKLVLGSDLSVASNKLEGRLDIQSGELKKIPGVAENISVLKILKNYLTDFVMFNKKSKDKEIGSGSDDFFKNNVKIDVDFKIVEGIKVDLQSIFGIIEDVNGNLLGGGKITGRDGKIKFIGAFDFKESSYILNGTDFNISDATIIFSKDNEYYPDFNPIIIFESYSKDSTSNYELSLKGEMKNLNFRIRKNNQTSSGNLASLFSKQEDGNNENNGSGNFLVENVLNSQITNTFLKPLSSVVKTAFGLSKLRISSNIEGINSSQAEDEKNTKTETYALGAKIQAEKHLTDSIFAIGEAGISGSNSDSSQGVNENKNSGSSFDEYKAGLEYRLENGKTIGVGVSRVTSSSSNVSDTQNQEKEKDNYYINFMFYRKYKDIGEMIREIF